MLRVYLAALCLTFVVSTPALGQDCTVGATLVGDKDSSQGCKKDGKKHGKEVDWYKNGKKRSEGHSKHGKLHGTQTSWYKSGQKMLESEYKDDEAHGKWTVWHENGQKK
jgi:hypothetical protein